MSRFQVVSQQVQCFTAKYRFFFNVRRGHLKKREFEELGISEFRWKCDECATGGRATDDEKKKKVLFQKEHLPKRKNELGFGVK